MANSTKKIDMKFEKMTINQLKAFILKNDPQMQVLGVGEQLNFFDHLVRNRLIGYANALFTALNQKNLYTQTVKKLVFTDLKMPEWFKIKQIYWLSQSFMVVGIALEKGKSDNQCMPLSFEIDNEFKSDFVDLNGLDSSVHM